MASRVIAEPALHASNTYMRHSLHAVCRFPASAPSSIGEPLLDVPANISCA